MDLKNVFVFFAMVAVVISCRKEPEQGPRGPQGPPGPAGGVESDLYTVNESDWVF